MVWGPGGAQAGAGCEADGRARGHTLQRGRPQREAAPDGRQARPGLLRLPLLPTTPSCLAGQLSSPATRKSEAVTGTVSETRKPGSGPLPLELRLQTR